LTEGGAIVVDESIDLGAGLMEATAGRRVAHDGWRIREGSIGEVRCRMGRGGGGGGVSERPRFVFVGGWQGMDTSGQGAVEMGGGGS